MVIMVSGFMNIQQLYCHQVIFVQMRVWLASWGFHSDILPTPLLVVVDQTGLLLREFGWYGGIKVTR